MSEPFEIFLVVPPGLEPMVLDEVNAQGFESAEAVPGGVTLTGGWPEVWRANLVLRGAVRVLARIGSFRAMHLAQLDKRAKKFDWSLFEAGASVSVDVTCKRSRIYHDRAARQRIEGALTAAGLTISKEASHSLKVRIEDDLCTFSIDTSGPPLHKRGHKEAVGKAPLRETLAAPFLRMCGYDGTEPLVDPMCGSGTLPIEAAELSSGKLAGRSRDFAFAELTSFDAKAFEAMRALTQTRLQGPCFGYDRDQGAIKMATQNAERAGASVTFACQPIGALRPPVAETGLVIVNPPYGARIGNKKALFALYGALGAQLRESFAGWRLGLITSEKGLAQATGLTFHDISAPIPHGGLRIQLFQARL